MSRTVRAGLATVLVGLAFAGATGLTPAASASPTANEVRNTGTIGIGAIQVFDGQYKHPGQYDDLIPGGRFSGYAHTAGLYVGPGFCVRLRGWLYGTEQNPPPPSGLTDPQLLPGGTSGAQWELSDAYPGFDARALPASDPGCQNP
ncbi:hypothetical protein GCM10010185_26330 [Saccharothrix coeruleofusca]|uniref:Secreted protein n=1 Tax=Saccharothrix coeruleofusca TaxID=33919 RepID=A0A918EEI5_9PSEU|nr:hypothetical protein GCM10010185_26330 [Saccharothrix coeruleofusca]